jgi:hypothetical protein
MAIDEGGKIEKSARGRKKDVLSIFRIKRGFSFIARSVSTGNPFAHQKTAIDNKTKKNTQKTQFNKENIKPKIKDKSSS